ncbi:MAG: hypothetical protein M0Z32_08230 [Actinomycetota bacterium]|jgi:enolase|nr:hypothetical protein [Actinomycetota bacterium]MCL6092955.1 hypothetical protein [Actinomycetota bacterium]MDA8167713.1 hypothetical protein [Actinomycetota bacterium]
MAEIRLDSGASGVAMVPSGASTGKREALELRDSEDRRFGGKGVRTAIENIENIIKPELVGQRVFHQLEIDL